MEDLIIGEGSLEIRNVAKAIKESACAAVLLQNWRSLSYNLGISDVKILDLHRKFNRDVIQMEDLPREILCLWKAEKQSEATLKVLCESITECGARSVAESLQAKFSQVKSMDKYATNNFRLKEERLPPTSQNATMTKVHFYVPD